MLQSALTKLCAGSWVRWLEARGKLSAHEDRFPPSPCEAPTQHHRSCITSFMQCLQDIPPTHRYRAEIESSESHSRPSPATGTCEQRNTTPRAFGRVLASSWSWASTVPARRLQVEG